MIGRHNDNADERLDFSEFVDFDVDGDATPIVPLWIANRAQMCICFNNRKRNVIKLWFWPALYTHFMYCVQWLLPNNRPELSKLDFIVWYGSIDLAEKNQW